MNRAPAVMIAAWLMLASAPPAARAQAPPSGLSFGIGGGLSVPVNTAREVFRNGFNGQAFVRLDLGPMPFAIRADFTYQGFDLRAPRSTPAGTVTGGTGSVLGGVANAQIYLFSGHVRPYVLAGVGGYVVRTDADGAVVTPRSDTRLGADAGAGLALTLGVLNVYAEGRADNVFVDPGLTGDRSFELVPLTVGVVF